jgi:KaiC/GvpD/RAD55 family RecA-like ATPase
VSSELNNAANGGRGALSSSIASDDISMIHSGIAPLDELLGGVCPGRMHLLTGGPGTGKSTACLQFLDAGLRTGKPVALITLDRAADLASHACNIGLDLEPPLRAGRLLLVRFRTAFTSLLESSLPDQLIDDFGRLIADIHPERLVIDPLTPFLASRSASGAALNALTQLFEELGLTTIVTYPGDISAGYDARLDPVVQHAAAIVHLARGDSGINRMQIIQARSRVAPSTPIGFVLKSGSGLVTVDPDSHKTVPERPAPKRARSRVLRGEP